MPTSSVQVDASRLNRIIRNLGGNTRVVINKIILDVEAKAKISIAEPKHGQVYGGHQASAPGEPPATDTGNLVNSISSYMESNDTGIVAVGADYGAYLEFGTRRMAARPFLKPAMNSVADIIERHMDDFRRMATDG